MFLHAVCERITWVISKDSDERMKGFCEICVYLDEHFVVLERCLESVIFYTFFIPKCNFCKKLHFFYEKYIFFVKKCIFL